MGAIRTAIDLDDNRAVHNAVEEGHGQRRVVEITAPGVEVDVGHDRGGTLAAGVDDLVQQVGGLRAFAAFDLVEGEFVDDEPVEAGVIAEPFGQGMVGQACGQVGQQGGAGM